MLNARLKVAITAPVLFLLVLNVVNAAITQRIPLTKEEAVEISRKTSVVWGSLSVSSHYGVNVFHLNSTEVNQTSGEQPWARDSFPADRGVWIVVWFIRPSGAVSAVFLLIEHVVDEEDGFIWYESIGGSR